MSARRLKRARCAAMALRFVRPRCPECGKAGPHWIAGAGFWGAAGFWTCPKFYGADGRRLSLKPATFPL